MSNIKLLKDQHVMLLWPRLRDYLDITGMTFIQERISLQDEVCIAVRHDKIDHLSQPKEILLAQEQIHMPHLGQKESPAHHLVI